MREVPAKQLQKTILKELKNLPFTITRYGLPVAVVSKPDQVSGPVVVNNPAEVKKEIRKRNPEVCEHGYGKGYCLFAWCPNGKKAA